MATVRGWFGWGVSVLCVAAAAVAADGPASRPATGPTTRSTSAPATAPVDPQLATLIGQLDAEEPAARDAAAERLVGIGEPARAAVADAAVRADSPEVRARAAGVVARLNQAMADRLTTVTLKATDANPQDLIAEACRQGGVPVDFMPSPLWGAGMFGEKPPKVTVDYAGRPFWEVVGDLCDKAGVTVMPSYKNGGGLIVMRGRGDGLLAGPRCDAARATFVVKEYTHTRHVNYADHGEDGGDQVDLTLLFDPRLRPVERAEIVVVVTEATDDKGGSMVPTAPAGGRLAAGGMAGLGVPGRMRRMPVMPFNFANGPMAEVTLSLDPPAAGATVIRTLAGKVTTEVTDSADRCVIDDAVHAAHAVREAGPLTVELVRCDVADRDLSYDLSVRRTDGRRGGTALSDVKAEDGDGRPVEAVRTSRSSQTANGVTTVSVKLTTARPVKGPVRLVWSMPAKTRTVTLPFAFHDLALPKP